MLVALLVGKHGVVNVHILLLHRVRRQRNLYVTHVVEAEFWTLTAEVPKSNFPAKFFAAKINKKILRVYNFLSIIIKIENYVKMRNDTKSLCSVGDGT